jgi:hypothetical protein
MSKQALASDTQPLPISLQIEQEKYLEQPPSSRGSFDMTEIEHFAVPSTQ